MDGTNVRRLPAPPSAAPAPPHGPHRGTDASGAVSVEIDDAARDVRVVLGAGWRAGVGMDGLGQAVTRAVTGAVAARAAAWTADEPAPPTVPEPAPRPAGSPAEVVDGAWRDLREYQVRLTQLYDTAVTVTDPAGRVEITVRGGQLVSVTPVGPWAEGADDTDLAERLGEALRAALAAVGDLPERALDGSPPPPGRVVEGS